MTGFLRLLARNRLALAGGIVLALVVLVALLVPLLPLKPPDVTNTADRFQRPFSEGHWLGTDHLGRDLLSRLLWGTRLSLAVGTAAAVIAAVIGSAIGIVAGYSGCWSAAYAARGEGHRTARSPEPAAGVRLCPVLPARDRALPKAGTRIEADGGRPTCRLSSSPRLMENPSALAARRGSRVAEEIKSWLVAENMAPGDRLPNEQELIERFGMSKGTIREAMRILEAQGLVKIRTGPGGGGFVHEVSLERAWALLGNYFYFKNISIADIYQLRLVLEPELAVSVAGQLDESELARLEECVSTYDKPAVNAEEERAQHVASLRFHRILASYEDITLLGFLVGFMANILADLTVYRRLFEPQNLELWRKGRAYQAALIAALRDGDDQLARDTMRSHMQTARALMFEQEAEMERRFLKTR